MAVESNAAPWLADGVRLLGGRIQVIGPGLVQVVLPPDGWAELEGRILSPFFPPPPSPPRTWALTEEVWQRVPDAEWLAPGSGRFRQWSELARRRSPALVLHWVDEGSTSLAPVLCLLWKVESNGAGRHVWILASTTLLPEGPVAVGPSQEAPPWVAWMHEGKLAPASLDRRVRRFYRPAVDLTLQGLAGWLAPRAAAWAREQRARWEAERLQVAAHHQALFKEQGKESDREGLELHLKEMERSLAPRLRARPLLGLLLYLPPVQAGLLLDQTHGTASATEAAASRERLAHSGQAASEGGAASRDLRQPSQIQPSQATQEAAAHARQRWTPQVHGPAQPGQRSLGQAHSRRRPDSRPHA